MDNKEHVNGLAFKNEIYNAEEEKGENRSFRPYILLTGKVIPIHPAMTRYLVSHEYGHIIQYWIEHERGMKYETTTDFDREYAKLRNIECYNEYGCGRWHKNIGEILVNDLRICLFDSEIEFWPHEVKHPLECPQVIEFWKEMKEKFSYKEVEPIL